MEFGSAVYKGYQFSQVQESPLCSKSSDCRIPQILIHLKKSRLFYFKEYLLVSQNNINKSNHVESLSEG
jgi:hypothetical protein